MSYCVLADLYSYIPKLEYTSTSKPTVTQVETIIDNIAQEIDTALQTAGYELPVTDTDSLAFLKMLNALGAAAFAESGTLSEKSGDTHDSKLMRAYEKRIDGISKRELLPVDVSMEAEVSPASYATDNADDTTTEPEFTKGMKF